jgi:hypothetical protein
MKTFKANQVRHAIAQTLGGEGERAQQIELRLRRLVAADRSLGCQPRSAQTLERHYAFYNGESLGSGADMQYSQYEAFALLAGVLLLEHGLPQLTVAKLLRNVREQLQAAHTSSLTKNPDKIFDEQEIQKRAQPGIFAFYSTDPVTLAFARLYGSPFEVQSDEMQAIVCSSESELVSFMKLHRIPGIAVSMFEFSRLIHDLHRNLSHIEPLRRGVRQTRSK